MSQTLPVGHQGDGALPRYDKLAEEIMREEDERIWLLLAEIAGQIEGEGGPSPAEPLARVRMLGGGGSGAGSSEPIEKLDPGLPDPDFSELNLRPKFGSRFPNGARNPGCGDLLIRRAKNLTLESQIEIRPNFARRIFWGLISQPPR